ncbi:hypothetical protein K4H28_01640 [Deefgea tanakiae]|uniref:Uncharacterized protein n=1 Tax=Deefgea tanakiae TaxID=2865840 RepID=A0ABX8Z6Z5_9NEIS|nr:hypothetical protein [Deefgea tanakiae]QZA78160.1 hypothetical protein K4H28_01640 [Deefgea tanakiae]
MSNNIEFEIKTGKYKVIKSGTIRTSENEISFFIDGLSLKYIFSTTEDGKARFKSEVISDEEMIINLYNFSSKTGQGNKNPIEVGTFGDPESEFFVNFHVKSGEHSREFQYSFLISEK